MHRHRSQAILLVLLATAGCRHAIPPPASLPQDWQRLVAKPRPFAALYRLSCCGYRDLVLTVRADGGRLSLTVAVPPGGTVLAAWVEAGGGFLSRVKERCREPLPPGVLPVSAGSSLPLDPEAAAVLLSGVLPAGTRELPELPGWVAATTGELWWRARVEGPEPHWTRVLIGRSGEEKALLVADRKDQGGTLPHALSLAAGSVIAELVLKAWQVSDPAPRPDWLSAPICGAKP